MASIISFGKIQYHNFMSFADQEWDFSRDGQVFLISGRNHDLRVDDSGVCASNGSGKTNLVQGLMYALYGQFPYKVHNENILNKYSKGPDNEGYIMRVTLDFNIQEDNGEVQEYRIIRGVLKSAKSAIRLTLMKLNPEEDISKASSALTQQCIETILHLGFQSFQRLVMLSFDPSFNFFRMTASQKRDFIQALFDTGAYTEMWDLIKKDISRFSMSLQGEKVRLNTLQSQLVNCESEIKAYAASAKAHEKEIEDKIASLENDSLPQFAVKKEELEKKQEEAKVKVDEATARGEKVQEALGKIRLRMANVEALERSLNEKVAGYKREIAKHHGILSIVCDDCKVKVRNAYKLDEYEDGLKECNEKLQLNSQDIAKLQNALNRGNNALADVSDARMSAERELRTIESQIVSLGLEEQEVQLGIKQLQKEKQEIENSISDPKKIPMMGTYLSLKGDIKGCEKSVKTGEEDLHCLDICEKVVSPDGVRKNIVSRVVKSINELINRYLDELNTTIRCELDDQLDKYSIFAPQGWGIDYQNLSKGEQMKLLFATQLAFRKFLFLRLGVSCNCFILDEIVDQNFDTLSISRILDVLLDVAEKEKTHIYIISHRGEVSRLTDDLVENKPDTKTSVHRILVEKTNNISSITVVD